MRRMIALALAAALACTAPITLAACGQQGGAGTAGEAAASGEFSTLGDVFSVETQDMTSTFDEHRYICAFSLDGVWWRVVADLPEGMSEQINEAWVDDQDKVAELLSPLEVASADMLEPLSDDEVAALVGKTGTDLTADGFELSVGTLTVNGDVTDAIATKGSFDYLVTFDGVVEDENTEDPAAAVADMTVSAASVQGISWYALEAE